MSIATITPMASGCLRLHRDVEVMSWCMQSNADASLLSGAVNPTTIRQGLFGFNGGRNLLQSVKVCTTPVKGRNMSQQLCLWHVNEGALLLCMESR